MNSLEAHIEWLLSEGVRTSQVDAALAELEPALVAADAKVARVRKAVADIPETAETLRAVRNAEATAARLRDLQAKLLVKQEKLVNDAQSWWAGLAQHIWIHGWQGCN